MESNQNNCCDLVDDLIHEIRSYNKLLNERATGLSYETQRQNLNKQSIEIHANMILDMSYKIKYWIDYVDYQFNENSFESMVFSPRSLYKTFDKAVRHFRRISRKGNRDINIFFNGESRGLTKSNEIIGILPYLLFENAMKYSPNGSDITLKIIELNDLIEIKMTSSGPYIEPNERESIFNKGFRGINAKALTDNGKGRGMSFIKFICDLHNADLKIIFGNKYSYKLDDIDYSDFEVVMSFPLVNDD